VTQIPSTCLYIDDSNDQTSSVFSDSDGTASNRVSRP